MLIELALAVTIVKTYNYFKSGHAKLKNSFKDIMLGVGLKNKQGETFYIKKIIDTSYGYKVIINIPKGLSTQHLEDKINILQDNLNSLIEINKNPFKENITMYLVNKDIFKFKFKPVQQLSNQLYIGRDIKQQSYFIDLNKHPMVLICGVTGQGKTMLLSSIITNLIYNCSKEIELWFTQLIKGELHSFDNCNPVMMSAYEENDVYVVISKLRNRLDKRTELFKKYGIRNITQWNNHFESRKMKRIILICEEMSELMECPDLWNMIWGIVKAGRAVGIHLIGAMQRITATNIDTNVRSQMAKITFKQNNEADSRLTLGTKSAMELDPGECIVAIDGEHKIKVPWIDDDFTLLNKYVPEIRVPGDEIQEEVTNIRKNNYEEIQIIETPPIIEIDEDNIKPVEKEKKRKGVVSLEEIKDVNRKR